MRARTGVLAKEPSGLGLRGGVGGAAMRARTGVLAKFAAELKAYLTRLAAMRARTGVLAKSKSTRDQCSPAISPPQ